MTDNRYKRLLSNTVVFAFGTFLSKAIVYLLMPFYTRWLEAAESDASDLIQQISNFIMPVAAIGVCEALMRFTIDAEGRKKEVFSSSVFILLCGSGGLLVFSPLLTMLGGFVGEWSSSYAVLIVLFVLCANIQMAVSYYARSQGKTVLYASQGIINTLLTVAFNIVFLGILDLGTEGFILSITLSNLITAVFLIVYLRMWRDFSFRYIRKDTVKDLLVYGIPLVPTTLLWSLTNITDKVIVRNTVSVEANGIFVYAYKIPTVLTLLTTVFIEAWQLSAVRDAKGREERGSFFHDVFRSYSSLIFVVASGLILLIKPLSTLLLSEGYRSAWQWMPTLIVATVFSAFSTFMSTVYMVNKKSLPAFLTALAGAAVNIILSLVLAKPLGVQGVCIATVVSYVILFIIRYITSRKYVDFSIYPVTLTVNAVLISLQAILMVMQYPAGKLAALPMYYIPQLILFVVCLGMNLRPLLSAAKVFAGGLLRKIKH